MQNAFIGNSVLHNDSVPWGRRRRFWGAFFKIWRAKVSKNSSLRGAFKNLRAESARTYFFCWISVVRLLLNKLKFFGIDQTFWRSHTWLCSICFNSIYFRSGRECSIHKGRIEDVRWCINLCWTNYRVMSLVQTDRGDVCSFQSPAKLEAKVNSLLLRHSQFVSPFNKSECINQLFLHSL